MELSLTAPRVSPPAARTAFSPLGPMELQPRARTESPPAEPTALRPAALAASLRRALTRPRLPGRMELRPAALTGSQPAAPTALNTTSTQLSSETQPALPPAAPTT